MNTLQGLINEFLSLYEILYVVVPIVVTIVLLAMRKEAKKLEKDMDANRFVMHQGKVAPAVGIACFLFFAFCIFAFTFLSKNPDSIFSDDGEWWQLLIFYAFALFGLFLAVATIAWEVRVDGNNIRFRSLFMKTKKFTFDDITRVEIREHQTIKNQYKLIIHSELEELMYIESHSMCHDFFVSRLEQKGIEFIMTDEHYGL